MAPLVERAGFDEKMRGSLMIVLGEAITNCIRHSYQNEPGHPIDVSFEEFSDQVVFRIRDYGKRVDLEEIKRRENPKLPPEKGGGLGVFIMKSMMDEVTYCPVHPEGNELMLMKKKARSRE